MKNNDIVKKPDELVKMRANFSEIALKFTSFLLSQLTENENVYQVSVSKYVQVAGTSNKDIYKSLFATAKELTTKTFTMQNREKNEFEIYNFVASVTYKHGTIEIEFSPKLKKYLLAIRDRYLTYKIENILPIRGKYPIRIYEMLKNELDKKIKHSDDGSVVYVVSLQEMRENLSIPDTYIFVNIKKMIERAQREIIKHTDIVFDYEFIKTGRRFTHIQFTIKPKTQEMKLRQQKAKLIQQKVKKDKNMQEIVAILPDYLRTTKIIQVLLSALEQGKSKEYIKAQIQYCLSIHQKKKIDNFAGYLLSAIERDYACIEENTVDIVEDWKKEIVSKKIIVEYEKDDYVIAYIGMKKMKKGNKYEVRLENDRKTQWVTVTKERLLTILKNWEMYNASKSNT